MSWTAPTEFPDLRLAPIVGIDLETRDPNLLTLGPGGVRGDGYVIGISVATDVFQGYYPIGHDGGGNLDRAQVLAWLQDVLGGDNPKVGAKPVALLSVARSMMCKSPRPCSMKIDGPTSWTLSAMTT
jgi:hypothetical protein